MKIAVSGKGGVGKTTLSALMAGALALKGQTVIALDADPDANLASALGAPEDEPITPLVEMGELIRERTGSADNYGGYFKINPKVDDIPETYALRMGPIRVLTLGGIQRGGSGCLCPATALIKALLTHLVIGRDETVIMDMEAGVEHLGRATAQSMDALLVVADPGPWSAQTAHRVRKLAHDIGLKNVYGVANRVTCQADTEQIRRRLEPIPLLGHLPEDPRLAKGILTIGKDGRIEPSEAMVEAGQAVDAILSQLQERT